MQKQLLFFLLIPLSVFGQNNFKACNSNNIFPHMDFGGPIDFSDIKNMKANLKAKKKKCKKNGWVYYYKSKRYIEKRLEVPMFSTNKTDLQTYFKKEFKIIDSVKYTELYKLTFVVNCKGEVGEFIWAAYDDQEEASSNEQELLVIAKRMKLWTPATYKKMLIDHYVTIYFRIKENVLTVFYRNKNELFQE